MQKHRDPDAAATPQVATTCQNAAPPRAHDLAAVHPACSPSRIGPGMNLLRPIPRLDLRLAFGICALIAPCGSAIAAPVPQAPSAFAAMPWSLPFDFSHSALAVSVRIHGSPAQVLVDTGVDPSAIDLQRATALGLRVERADGGEASGEGDAAQALVYPATITGLSLQGHASAPIAALATDLSAISQNYGSTLDGVLGYSFLQDKIMLVDYAAKVLRFYARAAQARSELARCRQRWQTPLRSYADDSIPIVPTFRFGTAEAPISLDTGSNGGISLYQSALDLPGVRAALRADGETHFAGARGDGHAQRYVLQLPVGFGPFTLPPGTQVTLRHEAGALQTRVANVGNALFAQMQLKILLNYREHQLSFYGDCH